jgi:anti-sigma regulatory factor (Ser/Thr protein kinase)
MVSESFTPIPSQVAAARHFAVGAAEAIGCCPADLALVVSELATNACVHAHTPFTVSLNRHESGLLVEVADEDPSPVTIQPLATGASGRGMQIVAAVAKDWGTSHCGPGGKSVWAVLGCP